MSETHVNPRRRRFRFSLRTLFGALPGWIAWNVRQVHQRGELLRSLSARGVMFGGTASAERPHRVPFLWSVLGAKPIGRIDVPSDMLTDDDMRRVKTLFPESKVANRSPVFDPLPRAVPRKVSPR